MTRPRRYLRPTIDWGDVLSYIIAAGVLAFLAVQVILSIGEGRLP